MMQETKSLSATSCTRDAPSWAGTALSLVLVLLQEQSPAPGPCVRSLPFPGGGCSDLFLAVAQLMFQGRTEGANQVVMR